MKVEGKGHYSRAVNDGALTVFNELIILSKFLKDWKEIVDFLVITLSQSNFFCISLFNPWGDVTSNCFLLLSPNDLLYITSIM